MLRARAGVSYALMEAVANGDCGLPQEDLLSLAEKLLEIGPIIAEAMRLEAATGGVVEDVIDGRPCVFLPHLHRAEQVIAAAILKLQAGAPPWPTMDAQKAFS
jgi:exodeoxyribonuclease V alpha subunit